MLVIDGEVAAVARRRSGARTSSTSPRGDHARRRGRRCGGTAPRGRGAGRGSSPSNAGWPFSRHCAERAARRARDLDRADDAAHVRSDRWSRRSPDRSDAALRGRRCDALRWRRGARVRRGARDPAAHAARASLRAAPRRTARCRRRRSAAARATRCRRARRAPRSRNGASVNGSSGSTTSISQWRARRLLVRRWLGGADVHAAVDLARVGVDDLAAEAPRQARSRARSCRSPSRRRSRAARERHQARAVTAAAVASMMRGEAVDLQRRAADEPAVDVRLRHELGDVVRRDGAAVEDAHAVGDGAGDARARSRRISAIASCAVGAVGGEPGADRPHRLVGDDEVRPTVDAVEAAARLADEHVVRLAGLALLQRLADAHDRLQAVRERGLHAPVHRLVGLAEELAPLAVADDDVLARPRRPA